MRYFCVCVLLVKSMIFCQGYYGEDLQDKYVNEEIFHGKKTGFFIDIGAHEGIDNSNTYFFEQLGWKGICFEPDPRNFKKLKENRSCVLYKSAVGSKNGIENFIKHPCSYVSGLDRTYQDEHRKCWRVPKKTAHNYFIKVQVVRLNKILAENNVTHIDFLSIDTEGAEKDIITSIDFDKYYIKAIVLENKYCDKSIRDFLEQKGFLFLQKVHRDEFYLNTN